MPLEKKAFRRYSLEEKEFKDIFTVRMNKEEREMLDLAKKLLQQNKDSTAFKQLAKIGYEFVLQDKKISILIKSILENKRKNKDRSIVDFE